MTDHEIYIGNALRKGEEGGLIVAAARDYGIPRSTPQDRIKDSQPHQNVSIMSQSLSPVQEESITNWIKEFEVSGNTPPLQDIRLFAQVVLA